MSVQIQFRRGTAAAWTSANPTLANGELGIETDTNKIKIGDGTTAWTSLSYWSGGGAGIADGDYGDITVSGGGTVMSVDSGAVAHSELASVTSDQHHAKSHIHDGADGSGTVAHSATTGRTANDHHNQSHNHSSASDGTTLTPGTLNLPTATAPTQTADGQVVWDSDDDVLTVGTGTATKDIGPLDSTAPSTQAFGDSATAGTARVSAHRDHKHGMPALGTTTQPVGTAAGGSATTPSKSDHVHATGAGTPSTQAFGDAAATGTGPAAAMTDHKHAMPANPVTAHEAASDPHTGYQKESEKAAANGYAGLGAGGYVPTGQLGSGTPDGTKYLRDDNSWVAPTAAPPTAVSNADAAAGDYITREKQTADTNYRLTQALDATGRGAVTFGPGNAAQDARLARSGTKALEVDDNAGGAADLNVTGTLKQAGSAVSLASDLTAHAGAADPHTGYRLESADHTHASTGLQGGQIAHTALTTVGVNDHHARDHASTHAAAGADPFLDAVAPSTQAIGDAAASGSATVAAKRDHKHAMPSFASPAFTYSNTAGAGAAGTLVRSDAQLAIFDSGAPATQAFGDTAATGSAGVAARRDHKHAMMANPVTGLVEDIEFVIDGGGSAIATGIKGDLQIDFACTIVSATLLADATGSIVVDIWKDTYANFPPTVADTITASAKPTISSAAKATDSTLTGWTKTISAGDILRFNVDSASTITRVTLVLKVTRS